MTSKSAFNENIKPFDAHIIKPLYNKKYSQKRLNIKKDGNFKIECAKRLKLYILII